MSTGSLKVLMTADTIGGIWIYALDLAKALGHFGVQVVLATMGAPLSFEQRKAARNISNLEIRESRYRLEWMDDPWEDVGRSGEWLLNLANQVDPDLIHLNGFCHASLPWERPVILVSHSDVVSWWRAVHGHEPPPSWSRYRTEVTRGLRSADVIIAPSFATMRDTQMGFGPLPSMKVIPNGRDFPDGLQANIEKRNVILAVGRVWDPAKNFEVLDSIAPKLPWPVHIAGDTADPLGDERKLSSAVPLGRTPPAELARRFAAASIYALPAFYEPFGLSVLEAAAAGCALVLGDIPSLRENWEGAAHFVDPTDSRAIELGLLRLIERPDERAMLAKRARFRALSFSVRATAHSYYREYLHLTRPSSGERQAPLPAKGIAR